MGSDENRRLTIPSFELREPGAPEEEPSAELLALGKQMLAEAQAWFDEDFIRANTGLEPDCQNPQSSFEVGATGRS